MDTWEDDDSISESSSTYPSDLRIREFNNPHYNNENSESSPDSKLFLFPLSIVSRLLEINS